MSVHSLPEASQVPEPARHGAASEFESLLEPLLRPAFNLAFSLTRQREDAEDLVQGAALRAFAAYGRFEQGTNFRAWFFRILANGFLHQQRDRSRRPQTSGLDELPEWSLYSQMKRSGLASSERDPASELLRKLDGEEVRAAFAGLPEDFRLVALLYFEQDFSYQEIAEIACCPVGTVRSRLHRARKLLQRELWQTALERGVVSERPASGLGGKR
jgi:RNA polymerase sigma-70 factor (ECF subfamily)